jgi:hypothetical protein
MREQASAMRRVADVMDKVIALHGDQENKREKPMFDEDMAMGAALLLRYIRDLVTCGNRETYDRGTLLVLLQTISEDDEIFPCGVARLVWAEEQEELEDDSSATESE